MKSIKELLEGKEQMVREIVILKVKRYTNRIAEEDFKNGILAIRGNEGYCKYIEELSRRAFKEVIKKLQKLEDDGVKFEIAFDEQVIANVNGYLIYKRCDIVILSSYNLEVIKISALEDEIVSAFHSLEMKLIALGAIDKYLCNTGSDDIDLTIIQPNLLMCSTFRTSIEKLIEICEECI